MAVDYVLLRPKRKDNVGRDFDIVLRKAVNTRSHVKLGLYDPKNGKAEEWCYKEDYEFFKGERKNEID